MMNIRELSTSEIMQVDGAGPIKDFETGSVIGTVKAMPPPVPWRVHPDMAFWRCYRVFLGIRLGIGRYISQRLMDSPTIQ